MKTVSLLLVLALALLAALGCAGDRPAELRGVWLTNVDSRVLESRAGIAEAMQFLADHNFNIVYPVVWNKGVTLYPSAVMDSLFGIRIDTMYRGRDPLAEVVEEAHRRGIAVVPWFEFGFSSSYKLNGGHLLARKPGWAARDASGSLLLKNGFEWMDAYNPEVQEFLLAMIREVASGYDVDGVQGDDRLPAQPSEGGYSEYTRSLYRQQHGGAEPPADFRDAAWLRWRADILNAFAARVHGEVKAIKPHLLVTWSPSVYPWSYEEYLQDWPAWVRAGHADLVHPQVYRYSREEYGTTLATQTPAALGLGGQRNIIYPGVLISLGPYLIPDEDLTAAVAANRAMGFNGEVFFFFEGLRRENARLARALLATHYARPARLPFPTRN